VPEERYICSECGISKPAKDFPHRKRNIFTFCKACKLRKRNLIISKEPREYLKVIIGQLKTPRTAEGFEFTITIDDLVNIWNKQEGRCAISGLFMTHHKDGMGIKELNASIDRLVPEKGYIKTNIQLVCHRINTMRHTLPLHDFYWWVKTIHAHNKFKTIIEKNPPDLTDKALKFCYLVANGSKKSDAYREAYDTNNMSKESISTEAYRLSKNPKIIKQIKELSSSST
tara:strand:+ start:253 stop:936 length:684 start_codon:yes stop_codon:yes gene_type:complete